MTKPIIFWFRQDLRLKDNPGLLAAIATGKPVIPVYILDDESPGQWRMGGASRWWLHHSLEALTGIINQHSGSPLLLRRGAPEPVLRRLCEESGADAIFCTRQYEPWAAKLEQNLHLQLQAEHITFKRFSGSLLFEPGTVLTQSGSPFKVFTPFWRRCRSAPQPPRPQPAPRRFEAPHHALETEPLKDWQLTPGAPNWAEGWAALWQPGPEGAAVRLQAFLNGPVGNYEEGRNQPAQHATSLLSPHLHFGEISPRMVWHAATAKMADQPALSEQINKFLSELGWREFSYHLLHHFPDLPEKSFKPQFSHFPWERNDSALRAWQRGQTGYPMVDAGMRELWQTGYMHNRVRMITASFLTKHLRLHWRLGEQWFWDTLLDADLANNASSWQWVAGSGADASPYFRIFNPTTQGQKFDRNGEYIRHWLPELAGLPDKYLCCPSEAPDSLLERAGVILDHSYPRPIVDHSSARRAALAAYDVARDSFNA